jgi:hypothetical protein
MPLSPQDILPAIPRQKVKNIQDKMCSDIIGSIINLVGKELLVDTKLGLRWWRIEDCELLPEEPRDFKVGDKVKVLGYYDQEAGDAIYATITAVVRWEKSYKTRYSVSGHIQEVQEESDLRHATPLEISKYFN